MSKLAFVMYLIDDTTEIVETDFIHNFNFEKEEFIEKFSIPPKVKVDWWHEEKREMLILEALVYFVGGK